MYTHISNIALEVNVSGYNIYGEVTVIKHIPGGGG